ncbi:hypothetical protein [Mesorhizobium sp. CN2-181]|uniref:hypothetical protein n=1 Tax=Mesorhizobium yinganensis TaxID=3157707 RepID=UPI0032B7B93B
MTSGIRIPITDDELVLDEELAASWGVSTRTLNRYEKLPNGLPFWMVGGRKFRGVKASANWLAGRAHRPNPSRRAA